MLKNMKIGTKILIAFTAVAIVAVTLADRGPAQRVTDIFDAVERRIRGDGVAARSPS